MNFELHVKKMQSIVLLILFLYLSTLYLTRCDASQAVPKLSLANSNDTINEAVTETQHASCKIVSEELVASARATVTRVLTGACNAKTIDEKFESLERNLTKELAEIKSLLYAILDERDSTKPKETSNDEGSARMIYYENRDKDSALSPRQKEIDKFNATVQEITTSNGTARVFIYYWQIKRFDEKLSRWKTARWERSSTFYVGPNGYGMYMKVTPRYFPDGTVFIAVGLTRGRYDYTLKWPFPLKIRLEVLDHSAEHQRLDRRSRVWDPSTLCSEYFWGRPKLTGEPDNPECVGLSVSRQALFSKLSSTTSTSSIPLPYEQPSRSTRYLWNGLINAAKKEETK